MMVFTKYIVHRISLNSKSSVDNSFAFFFLNKIKNSLKRKRKQGLAERKL